MIGSFKPRPDYRYVQLRQALLDGRQTLPGPAGQGQANDGPAAGPPDELADELLAQVGRDGLGMATLGESLSDDDFVTFGTRFGLLTAETDPAVQPYVASGVILNLVAGMARTEEVSLQPFSVGPLTLHSEGSGRPLAEQPRYIILMCCCPGADDAAAPTLLVPMAGVLSRLDPAVLGILERTRYHGRDGMPTIAMRIGERLAFSFRDFDGDTLRWECEAPGVTEAEVIDAIAALLDAMYAPAGTTGLAWKRGRIVVIDNTYFFHGRRAGQLGPGQPRHLKRLRVRASLS
jgi:hypothetical protein